MDFYRRDPRDPDWLARVSDFHGHLGPWLVLGAMAGRDAVSRLNTPGHWKIDVVCWMPSDKHRTPFTCILDGLQAGCGATMGKQNLRLMDSAAIAAANWPVVYVMRLPEADRPAEGLVYEATCELHGLIRQVRPDRLEEGSRELAGANVADLFRITPMGPGDFARMERPAAPSDRVHA